MISLNYVCNLDIPTNVCCQSACALLSGLWPASAAKLPAGASLALSSASAVASIAAASAAAVLRLSSTALGITEGALFTIPPPIATIKSMASQISCKNAPSGHSGS